MRRALTVCAVLLVGGDVVAGIYQDQVAADVPETAKAILDDGTPPAEAVGFARALVGKTRPPGTRNLASSANTRGYRLFQQGKLDDALELFIVSADLDPSYGMPRYNAARVLALRGDLSGAVKWLQGLKAMGRPQQSRLAETKKDEAFKKVWTSPEFALLFVPSAPPPSTQPSAPDASKSPAAGPQALSPVEVSPVPQSSKSIREALRDQLGGAGPVVIGINDGELVAFSADGKLRRTIVPGPLSGAELDNRSEVIWYQVSDTKSPSWLLSTSSLFAVDLRAVAVRPVRVARDIRPMDGPDIAYENPAEQIFSQTIPQDILVLSAAGPSFKRRLECGGKHQPSCRKPVVVPCEPAPKDRHCPLIEPDAIPFLKQLGERADGRRLSLPVVKSARLPRFELEQDDACPRCGRAAVIPGTSYWTVSTEIMGDVCHVLPQVFDPKRHEFVNIDDGQRSRTPFGEIRLDFGDVWVDASGRAFIEQDNLYTFERGQVALKDYSVVGFLDPAYWVASYDYSCF